MTRVAINGLGRIGRATLKRLIETPELELVAVNDLVPAENLAYLLKYDTVYGRYDKEVTADDGGLVVDGQAIPVFSEKDPESLPWKDQDVEVVFECTGIFTQVVGGNLVKVMSWYDNEWGYSCQMVRSALAEVPQTAGAS